MRTLAIKNTWKNLTLVAVGALMATMIAIPLTGIASANSDDDFSFHPAPDKVTYTIKASNGVPTTFELIERNGRMVLTLYVEDKPAFIAPDDED